MVRNYTFGMMTRKVTSMVDDLEIAKRAQAAVAVSTQGSSFLVPPAQSASSTASVTDAVHLSASAADIITQLRASKTIAEAWLQQKIKTPDLTDPDSLHTKRNLFANINTFCAAFHAA